MTRGQDLTRLYGVLEEFADHAGGRRRLGDCTGYQEWPDEGVAFLFAADETREDGDHPRLVHVEAAPAAEAGGSLWAALRAHRGSTSGRYKGGGTHRDSPLRRRVGEAILARDDLHDAYPDWGAWTSESRPIREAEHDLECAVSDHLRDLTVLAVDVPEGSASACVREWVAANAAALASNAREEPAIDPRGGWLGDHSPDDQVRESGLWTVEAVCEPYDPRFLDLLEAVAERAGKPAGGETGGRVYDGRTHGDRTGDRTQAVAERASAERAEARADGGEAVDSPDEDTEDEDATMDDESAPSITASGD